MSGGLGQAASQAMCSVRGGEPRRGLVGATGQPDALGPLSPQAKPKPCGPGLCHGRDPSWDERGMSAAPRQPLTSSVSQREQ